MIFEILGDVHLESDNLFVMSFCSECTLWFVHVISLLNGLKFDTFSTIDACFNFA